MCASDSPILGNRYSRPTNRRRRRSAPLRRRRYRNGGRSSGRRTSRLTKFECGVARQRRKRQQGAAGHQTFVSILGIRFRLRSASRAIAAEERNYPKAIGRSVMNATRSMIVMTAALLSTAVHAQYTVGIVKIGILTMPSVYCAWTAVLKSAAVITIILRVAFMTLLPIAFG